MEKNSPSCRGKTAVTNRLSVDQGFLTFSCAKDPFDSAVKNMDPFSEKSIINCQSHVFGENATSNNQMYSGLHFLGHNNFRE
jgi:hypothetical protein